MKIDVSEILRAILPSCRSESDLSQRLSDECFRMFGDAGQSAVNGIVSMLDTHARNIGLSRFEAARQLADAEAIIQQQTFTSLEEVPPEIRDRMREIRSGGGNVHVTRKVVTHGPRGTMISEGGDAMSALKEHVRRDAGPFSSVLVLPGGRGRLAWVLVGIILATIVGGTFLFTYLRHRTERPGIEHSWRVDEAVRALEKMHAAKPDDVATSLRLGEAYARKIVAVRSLDGLRRYKPGFSGDQEKLGQRWDANLAEMEAYMGIEVSAKEMHRTSKEGEALVRRLLARDDVSAEDEATAWLLLGHFLLAQERFEEARETSGRAAALDGKDPRPHMLNAKIFEDKEQYEQAIKENHVALSTMSAWIRKDPSLLRQVLWGMGSPSHTSIAKEHQWRAQQEKLAKDLALGIQMHIQVLKLKQKAKTVFEEQ